MPTPPPSRPTIRDVARKAGVSKTTVSAALLGNQHVSEKTRKRIHEVARQMGYSPNVAAATLATRGTMKSGFSNVAIVTHFNPKDSMGYNDYTKKGQLHRLQTRLSELGYESHMYDLTRSGLSSDKLRDLLYSRGYSGIIFDQIREEHCGLFSTDWSPFSLVCLARTYDDPPCDTIQGNHFASIRLIWREIRRAGYRRIGFLLCRHHPAMLDDMDREGAFAVCQAELSADETAILPYLGLIEDRHSVEKWFRRYRPDAVMGFNIIHYLMFRAMGLQIPGEVAYANLRGVDPNYPIAGVNHFEHEARVKAAEHVDFLIRHKRTGIPELRWEMITPIRWVPGESLPVNNE